MRDLWREMEGGEKMSGDDTLNIYQSPSVLQKITGPLATSRRGGLSLVEKDCSVVTVSENDRKCGMNERLRQVTREEKNQKNQKKIVEEVGGLFPV
ncbi:hypothetical protein O3M35_007447 [Rhynocoris fuscipes]|uniref:Uncharacterized protein n=1 Tax=Rhynocoris fuscipes TaxID=488301 RepID=A0AAW1D9G2_9HEMI